MNSEQARERIVNGMKRFRVTPENIDEIAPADTNGAAPAQREADADGRATSYELIDIADLLRDTTPLEFTVEGLIPRGAMVGFVAPPESAKSLLAQNLAACVATGQPFHGRSVRRGLAVYLHGEGQRGARLRFQALEVHYQMGLAGAPLVVSKVGASLIDPVEALAVRDAIKEAEDRHGVGLELLVVDTVARFIIPGDENAAKDQSALFAAIDALRGDAAVIACHHVGHADSTRARGSSAWRAALDAEYILSATDTAAGERIVTMTCQKMKDGDRPAPISFKIQTVETASRREDGAPVGSVVLVPTDIQAARPAATGKNQRALLQELEAIAAQPGESGVWTEGQLRKIARDLGMSKSSAITAVIGLRSLGYLTATVGGSRLTHKTGA
jgi:hypothetical protein